MREALLRVEKQSRPTVHWQPLHNNRRRLRREESRNDRGRKNEPELGEKRKHTAGVQEVGIARLDPVQGLPDDRLHRDQQDKRNRGRKEPVVQGNAAVRRHKHGRQHKKRQRVREKRRIQQKRRRILGSQPIREAAADTGSRLSGDGQRAESAGCASADDSRRHNRTRIH